MGVNGRTTRSSRKTVPTRSALPEHVVRAVLENPEPRLVIDRNGRIVLVNAAAEQRLGAVMSELVGRMAASLDSLAGAAAVAAPGRLTILAPP